MKINITTSQKTYPIYMERNAIHHINDYIDTNRNVFIVSDKNVPFNYIETIKSQCLGKSYVYLVPAGEQAKSFSVYEQIINEMLACHIDRHSLLIAIGGGVIGDLGGFVSSTYMRGIKFVNIPTTTLAQIDSSIGGKVAINVGNIKNIVGSFYPPECVIIDADTLNTLPKRHYVNGLIEAIKAGLIKNPTLFERFESGNVEAQIESIIYEALLIKKEIVEMDEFEEQERKLLNFGHTIGHALESYYELQGLLHGEAVAIGMLAMIEDEAIKQRLINVYKALSIQLEISFDADAIYQYIVSDKKVQGEQVSIIELTTINQPVIKSIPLEEMKYYISRVSS